MATPKFKAGDKVTYTPTGEKGIVKSVRKNDIFVVYNFGMDEENYRKYTAESTPFGTLEAGWPEPEEEGNDADNEWIEPDEFEDLKGPDDMGDICPNCGLRYTPTEALLRYCNSCNFDATLGS